MNFLALLGWAPDGETTIMSRDELIERFSLERVGSSPATFDYAKLDWMNGVYLRALDGEAVRRRLVGFLREQGIDWPGGRLRAAAPIVQEKIARLDEFAGFAGFLFRRRRARSRAARRAHPRLRRARARRRRAVGGGRVERALKKLCDDSGEKPTTVYLPIRVAVTGSRVSPGLYESLELLGKEPSLARIRAGLEAVS